MGSNRNNILAIDDNNDNLITLRALVSEAFPEAAFHSALSGAQGLSLAAETDPDVILLDIFMPVMDGFEVCRALKADPVLREIPIVFVTALKGDRETASKRLAAERRRSSPSPLTKANSLRSCAP
jgi:CheY-like chemotaxis protein